MKKGAACILAAIIMAAMALPVHAWTGSGGWTVCPRCGAPVQCGVESRREITRETSCVEKIAFDGSAVHDPVYSVYSWVRWYCVNGSCGFSQEEDERYAGEFVLCPHHDVEFSAGEPRLRREPKLQQKNGEPGGVIAEQKAEAEAEFERQLAELAGGGGSRTEPASERSKLIAEQKAEAEAELERLIAGLASGGGSGTETTSERSKLLEAEKEQIEAEIRRLIAELVSGGGSGARGSSAPGN